MKNNEYRLLDSGNCRKLEQVGEFRIIRPALNAFWHPQMPENEWSKADAVLTRDNRGNGHWEFHRELPEKWLVKYAGFNLVVKATAFGHLGFFAEQYRNWKSFENNSAGMGREVRALNLFAYSGIGSMAMARGGAKVTHLDAARGMVEWAQENLAANPDIPGNIRWIVDDVVKFCQREVRRGAKYQLIAMDPPTFGRGSKAQVWKIENDLPKLLELCRKMTDDDKPLKIVLSSHSPGFSAMVLGNMIEDVFGKGVIAGEEMTVPEATGRVLPAGVTVTYSR